MCPLRPSCARLRRRELSSFLPSSLSVRLANWLVFLRLPWVPVLLSFLLPLCPFRFLRLRLLRLPRLLVRSPRFRPSALRCREVWALAALSVPVVRGRSLGDRPLVVWSLPLAVPLAGTPASWWRGFPTHGSAVALPTWSPRYVWFSPLLSSFRLMFSATPRPRGPPPAPPGHCRGTPSLFCPWSCARFGRYFSSACSVSAVCFG